MVKNLLCVAILFDLLMLGRASTVEPSSPTIIFEEIGTIVSEMGWANLRISIDLSTILDSNLKECAILQIPDKNITNMLENEDTTESDLKKQVFQKMAMNLDRICRSNRRVINELKEVFSLNHAKKTASASKLEDNAVISNSKTSNTVNLSRKPRFAFTAIVVAIITSLATVFTAKELIGLSQKDDTDDIIDNSNNIVKSIQSHETRLGQQESDNADIKMHLEKLEKRLISKSHFDGIIRDLLIAEEYARDRSCRLKEVQSALYELLNNRLSPNLVQYHVLQRTLDEISDVVGKINYQLAIEDTTDVYQCDTSFVAFNDWTVIALIHLPIFKDASKLRLYQYRQTPITSGSGSKSVVKIQPERTILAINPDSTLYSTYQSNELHNTCRIFHNVYFCKNDNVLTRTDSKNCLLALYTNDPVSIKSLCSITVERVSEVVLPLNDTSFYTFSPMHTNIEIHCNSLKVL